MSKSQQSFNKKEREKKRRKKKQDKLERREQRKQEKAEKGKLSFEEQLSYVDENGHITSERPDPLKKKKFKVEDIVIGVPPKEESTEDPVRKGKVSTFLHDKGYGFIVDVGNQDSVFVHIKDAYESIQMNDKVTFEIEFGPKGAKAVNVALAITKDAE